MKKNVMIVIPSLKLGGGAERIAFLISFLKSGKYLYIINEVEK